jgi:RimJ/RimL family protein N-acetyltransferase
MDLARTYKIETERLMIRCYEPADTIKLHEAILTSADHLRPWLPWMQQEPKSLGERAGLIRFFRGQFDLGLDYAFGIFDKKGNEFIGSTGLHTRIGKNAREIGYWISRRHIGKGFATEAVGALTKLGFRIEGLSRMEIHCVPENIRSRHIPLKLGYKLETIITPDAPGDIRNMMIWALSKNDYDQSPLRHLQIRAFDFVGNELT